MEKIGRIRKRLGNFENICTFSLICRWANGLIRVCMRAQLQPMEAERAPLSKIYLVGRLRPTVLSQYCRFV
jgi:hypothetical protein